MNPTPPAAMAIVEAAIDDYRQETPAEQRTPAGETARIARELRRSGYAITPQPGRQRPTRQRPAA